LYRISTPAPCSCGADRLRGPLAPEAQQVACGTYTKSTAYVPVFFTAFTCQVRAVVDRTTKIKAVNCRGLGASVSVAVTLAPASSPVPMATTGLLGRRGEPPDGDAPVAMNTHYVNAGPVCREVTAMTLSSCPWYGRSEI
jgi:hypothetical protein